MRARDGWPGPDLRFELFQLLLLARMRLFLVWFRCALMLRSGFFRGLSRSCLWRRSCLGTRLLGRFRGMLDRCRLALGPNRCSRLGSGSGFGFNDGFGNWVRFGSWQRGRRLCLGLCSWLVFRYRTRGCGSGFANWFRSWARLSSWPCGRGLSSRHWMRLVYASCLCSMCRNRTIEVCDRGCGLRQGRMRWSSVIHRCKVRLVLMGEMFLLYL